MACLGGHYRTDVKVLSQACGYKTDKSKVKPLSL